MNIYDNTGFSEMHEGIRPGGLQLTEYMLKQCGLKTGDRVLDAGCGTGRSIEFMSQKYSLNTEGIDSSDTLLKSGMERFKSLNFVQGNAENLPFKSCSFDAVFAECSLSVMGNPGKVLSEIHRVLSGHGKLAISDVYIREPEYSGSTVNFCLNGCISGAFKYNDFISMLKDSGFNPVLWEDHSVLWKEFVARILLSNDSLCDIISSVKSGSQSGSVFLSQDLIKSKPGYFCLIAEKLL